MPSFAIRSATTEDIELIISLQEKIWEPTYRDILSKEQLSYMFEVTYSKASLDKQLVEDTNDFFILTNELIPVGFASIGPYQESFKLHKIYVLPAMQGTGAGKFLLNEVERVVVVKGGKSLYLNVNRFNKAKSFYEHMGYKVMGEEDVPIGPYWMNDYILKKTEWS
jgi:GNAT superfamily N-acetyltransferase